MHNLLVGPKNSVVFNASYSDASSDHECESTIIGTAMLFLTLHLCCSALVSVIVVFGFFFVDVVGTGFRNRLLFSLKKGRRLVNSALLRFCVISS